MTSAVSLARGVAANSKETWGSRRASEALELGSNWCCRGRIFFELLVLRLGFKSSTRVRDEIDREKIMCHQFRQDGIRVVLCDFLCVVKRRCTCALALCRLDHKKMFCSIPNAISSQLGLHVTLKQKNIEVVQVPRVFVTFFKIEKIESQKYVDQIENCAEKINRECVRVKKWILHYRWMIQNYLNTLNTIIWTRL